MYSRCFAAVVQFNARSQISELYKQIYKTSPRTRIRKVELRRLRSNERGRKSKVYSKRRTLFRINRARTGKDVGYGDGSRQPDMGPEEFAAEQEIILKRLEDNQKNRFLLEQQTIGQSNNIKWSETRKYMLTASVFGTICKAKKFEGHVKRLAHPTEIFANSVIHGKLNEDAARFQLEKQLGQQIKGSGLFIDEEFSYLGASPDGIIDEKTICEIKCPFSIAGLDPIAAIKNKKLKFMTVSDDGEITGLSKSHIYYYQIQGQLHISKRDICVFAIWTSTKYDLYVERIEKDDDFWENSMVSKLSSFYKDWLLPELVDPRIPRGMEVRSPL